MRIFLLQTKWSLGWTLGLNIVRVLMTIFVHLFIYQLYFMSTITALSKLIQIEYKRSYTHKANETAPPPRTVRSYLRAD